MVAAIKSPTPYQFNKCRVWPRQRSPIPRSHIQLKSTNCWRVCQKAISLQHHFQRVCQRLSRPSTSSLVSMPKGFLTLAQLAGECAQGLSRTSTIVWQVCHKGYLADVYGWLASMPKGCLAPACLLASMPKGYLAPASIAGEYAQGLSRSSTNCWRVCPQGYLASAPSLASMPKGYLAPASSLASMPNGCLAPAAFAGEYARGLSRSSAFAGEYA